MPLTVQLEGYGYEVLLGFNDSVSDGWRLLRFGFQMKSSMGALHEWISSALGLVCSGFNDAIPF